MDSREGRRRGLPSPPPQWKQEREVEEAVPPRPSPLLYSPWLTVQQAAARIGLGSNGRAPASIYEIARAIGQKRGGRWLIDQDAFEDYLVGGGVS